MNYLHKTPANGLKFSYRNSVIALHAIRVRSFTISWNNGLLKAYMFLFVFKIAGPLERPLAWFPVVLVRWNRVSNYGSRIHFHDILPKTSQTKYEVKFRSRNNQNCVRHFIQMKLIWWKRNTWRPHSDRARLKFAIKEVISGLVKSQEISTTF